MESISMNWPRGIPICRSRFGSDEEGRERQRDPTGGDGKVKCTKRERSESQSEREKERERAGEENAAK